jgi:DNA-binding CsgD family transcriptional regulator
VQLSARQEQVVRLLERGLTNGQIAEELGISLDGAKFHVTELMNRYGVHSREEAVAEWKRSRRTFGLPLAAPVVWCGVAAGVAVVVVAVAVWAAVLGNGGGGDAAAAQTATFTMTITFEPPGEPATENSFEGEVDFANKLMAFHGPDGAEQRFDSDWYYWKSADGNEWRKSRTPARGGIQTFTGPYWVEQMENGRNVETLGEESINGEAALRYRFTADYPFPPGSARELADVYKDTEVHFNIWLSGSRLLRLEQEVTFGNTGDPEIEGRRYFTRLEMKDWDRPVDIRLPDPSEVRE